MNNNTEPTYEELKAMFELERNIKNSLYYYLTFKNYLHSYFNWVNIAGMDNRDSATKRMQMLLHIEKIVCIRDESISKKGEIKYTISPN